MDIKEKTYSNAVCGNNPEVLEGIHQKDINIAIYQRNLASLENELSVASEKNISFKTSGPVDEIVAELKDFFKENLPTCNLLLKDINEVMAQFNAVANTSSYHLLLSTVNSNMCRKFHTDINDLRLLCTYIGPGTLWIAEDKKKHKRKNKAELAINEEQVRQAATGDVIILKGALYPEGSPIMHRSPTIEEAGEKRLCKRLLLRLDTNEFLNFN